MHALLGIGTGAAVLVGLSQPGEAGSNGPDGGAEGPSEDRKPLPVPARIAFATALGGLAALSSVGGGVMDTKVENALRRRGARHPRLWIGVAAAGISAVSALVDLHLDSDDVAADAPPSA